MVVRVVPADCGRFMVLAQALYEGASLRFAPGGADRAILVGGTGGLGSGGRKVAGLLGRPRLFEQHIRVGDYVSVGETDGFVTRIQIRATTIQTRDRKELLVPNKEFITSHLLNWSLSDPITRISLSWINI